MLFLALFSLSSHANFNMQNASSSDEKSLCEIDNREVSQNMAVARMLENEKSYSPCTATLIGKRCLITAGHCKPSKNNWITEFNTPLSSPVTGKLIHSNKEDIYDLDKIYGVLDAYVGKDWLVYSVKANSYTNKLPGELYSPYSISFELPEVGIELQITGYGTDSEKRYNNAQQESFGPLIKIENARTTLIYRVDTTGGNSGSAIVNATTNEIIGIHSHGGCIGEYAGNKGTLIAGNDDLIKAINQCLTDDQ